MNTTSKAQRGEIGARQAIRSERVIQGTHPHVHGGKESVRLQISLWLADTCWQVETRVRHVPRAWIVRGIWHCDDALRLSPGD